MPERAVLLANLGSPDSPSIPDVRAYLHEFLMDERVMDTPRLLRKFIVSCLILPKRSRASAEAYRSIWTSEGSPLVVTSRRVQALLHKRMDVPVGLAMRYGHPTTREALAELLARCQGGLRELFLIPLYPHYAMSSYETAVEAVRDTLEQLQPAVRLKVRPPFYQDPLYIDALTESAKPTLAGGYDHLLFSYHGLPERHLRKSDPTHAHCLRSADCCETDSPAHATCYRAQVFATTRAFAEKLGIPREKYSVSFQSRLGRDPWLKPYTDLEIPRLARDGVKRLLVICPAFVSDCLETLEEIGMRGRELFLEAGGESFELAPCMNEHPLWIRALQTWAES